MKKQGDVRKAVELMGREPLNPVGQCFESAIRQLLFAPDAPASARLCHGIGIANMPGQEGSLMGHAWVEYDEGLVRYAVDTTWGVRMEASAYRKQFQVSLVLEYTAEQTHLLWKMHDMPGPWDPRIRKITDGGSHGQEA